MYPIREVAKKTGISTYTLRYYEKLGILPAPIRTEGGVRTYTESDVQFVHFIKNLKNTGMSLEDIQEIVSSGCIMDNLGVVDDLEQLLHKRIEILTKHLEKLTQQKLEIEQVIQQSREKLHVYQTLLLQSERRNENAD